MELNSLQAQLLRACKQKKVSATYRDVQRYAEQHKKYNNLTMRQIDAVVEGLKVFLTIRYE